MEKIIVVSAGVDNGDGKSFGGQERCVSSFIRVLKNRYKVQLISLKFKDQISREYVDDIEVIRIPTTLSKRCEGIQDLFSKFFHKLDEVAFEFKDNLISYIKENQNDLKDMKTYIMAGALAEALIAKKLKEMGFYVIITYHYLRTERYVKGLFQDDYINMTYDLNIIPSWQRVALKSLKKIFKNEKQLFRFVSYFYRYHFKFLLPQKMRLYYENDILAGSYTDRIILLNNKTGRYLSWMSPYCNISNKIKVIRNGIDERCFKCSDVYIRNRMQEKFGLKTEDIIFLFVGRLDPMKGIEYLIEAMSYVEANMAYNDRNFKLLVVGECCGIYKKTYLPYLKILADRLERVEVLFTGPIYGEEKLALYDLSIVFILPSVYEPFGSVVLEAMAMGKPVIVSSFSGSSEIVDDDFGIIVNYDDISQRVKNLGEAIIKILYMDITSMGVAAKKEAEKYNWDNVVEECYV